ncbi:MAG: L-aspartate oxidase [Candidatus Aminicenantes bacterium RBG_16_63_16]|nr:MAG: L-aspartate oxidase [Candidatus Aminicenantes bacterium RBG_16_63_16]
MFRSDILVIGCGIAGASAALEAAKRGLSVNIITQAERAEESNTYYAQGGIVAQGTGDNPKILGEDIIRTGDGINNPEAVEVLAAHSREFVQKILIDGLKIPFTRSSPEALDYAQEAGHSRRRILHVKDTTGRTIEERFIQALKRSGRVRFFTGHTAVDLLTVPHHSRNLMAYYREPQCLGAYVLDNRTRMVRTFCAKTTVLATGGCGAVYLFTSNPRQAIGAGYAMAHRAGARIVNMEYIQFHPTTLYHRDADGFLISETVRGEGARLKTRDGRTFMEKYSEKKDLAPRDEVSRAIYEEMTNSDSSNVLLDLASYAKIDIPKRFPHIYKTCLEYGIDITKEPIPVVPAAHYSCGGVLVDSWGRSSLNSLYAVGEVSCTGLHGANRLASTSLLEGLVWGTRAAQDIAARLEAPPACRPEDIHPWYYPEREEEIDPALVNQDWLTIRSTMWNYAGIIRTRKRLERAKADLEYLRHRIEKFYREARMDSKVVGLKHGIQVALMITHAALANPVSLGAHFRKD